jgi:hypothetical protein
MATIWQQLGAFVVTVENLSNEALDRFAQAGGRWIVPVTFGDSSSGPYNVELLPSLKARARARGITTGIWVNGWGEEPSELVSPTRKLAEELALRPVIFDLEGADYKNENAPKFPAMLQEARRQMPGRAIGASTTGFADRAMIWNGRTLVPPKSLYDLKVRWLPQWYYRDDGKFRADWSTNDLRENGPTDGNIRDVGAPGNRGIPLPYVHGTLYVTGVYEHSLAEGIEDVRRAKGVGFSWGFSIYPLERATESDFDLLATVRDELFLV